MPMPRSPRTRSSKIANAVEVIKEGSIYIEKINGPMIFVEQATPAEYRAGLLRAITNGWLELCESSAYVKFTEAGATVEVK